jgi:hypothetical protein
MEEDHRSSFWVRKRRVGLRSMKELRAIRYKKGWGARGRLKKALKNTKKEREIRIRSQISMFFVLR